MFVAILDGQFRNSYSEVSNDSWVRLVFCGKISCAFFTLGFLRVCYYLPQTFFEPPEQRKYTFKKAMYKVVIELLLLGQMLDQDSAKRIDFAEITLFTSSVY